MSQESCGRWALAIQSKTVLKFLSSVIPIYDNALYLWPAKCDKSGKFAAPKYVIKMADLGVDFLMEI